MHTWKTPGLIHDENQCIWTACNKSFFVLLFSFLHTHDKKQRWKIREKSKYFSCRIIEWEKNFRHCGKHVVHQNMKLNEIKLNRTKNSHNNNNLFMNKMVFFSIYCCDFRFYLKKHYIKWMKRIIPVFFSSFSLNKGK